MHPDTSQSMLRKVAQALLLIRTQEKSSPQAATGDELDASPAQIPTSLVGGSSRVHMAVSSICPHCGKTSMRNSQSTVRRRDGADIASSRTAHPFFVQLTFGQHGEWGFVDITLEHDGEVDGD